MVEQRSAGGLPRPDRPEDRTAEAGRSARPRRGRRAARAAARRCGRARQTLRKPGAHRPGGATYALALNTRVAPFDRLAVRRALNYAIDRNRIARLAGSSLTAQPTCQVLAPTLPGYRPYCPYTLDPGPSGSWTAPDLAQGAGAGRLVRDEGNEGDMLLTMPTVPRRPRMKIGRYVVSVLNRLGYKRVIEGDRQHQRCGARRARGLAPSSRSSAGSGGTRIPDPCELHRPLLTCRAFVPRSANNLNMAEFCDRRIDAESPCECTRSRRATRPPQVRLWGRSTTPSSTRRRGRRCTTRARLTVLGAQVGNYQYHPFWTVLLDQLWVR